eukprot:TRINITY_DN29491_c0_g1_i1.p1 TRINITY_DN29491_c0_g1~~TRINITY_DN29491_c0_g1_i1.p1  ORF type:complete len:161 (-),score=38.03 TRINITY_DN29491_c0_g1_i1:55-537(-)
MPSKPSVWSNLNSEVGAGFGNTDRGTKHEGSKHFGHNSQKTFGPFGSNNNNHFNFGPASLPPCGFKTRDSKIYDFELNSSSSNTSGPHSMLTLGMEPKQFSWNNSGNSWMDTSSGGSSRCSSGHGSSNQLDWSGAVEGVFRDEIGRMAEGYRRNSRYMAF